MKYLERLMFNILGIFSLPHVHFHFGSTVTPRIHESKPGDFCTSCEHTKTLFWFTNRNAITGIVHYNTP